MRNAGVTDKKDNFGTFYALSENSSSLMYSNLFCKSTLKAVWGYYLDFTNHSQ